MKSAISEPVYSSLMTSMKPGTWPSPITGALLAVSGNQNTDVQVVRVRALLRRHVGSGSPLMCFGSLALDPARKSVTRHAALAGANSGSPI